MTSGINLFVAPLDKNVDDELLKSQFAPFGEIFRASVAKDEFGASKKFGFVHFVYMEEGLRAMKEMTGKRLLNNEIHVDVANNQERRCYTGHKESIWANDMDSNLISKCTTTMDCLSIASDTQDEQSRPEVSDVMERMRNLFESQKYTDVTFYPKNNRKVSISGHRAVLAVGSPLFTKMLFGDGNESTAGVTMEVEISNLSFGAFTNIVKYLYTDEVFFESDALVQDILQGAREFEIPSLVNRCQTYFETIELTSQNVCSKLQMSISNKITALKERCVDFVQRNTLQVINSSDFQKCSPTTARTICSLQSLNLQSEAELLIAVMFWLQAQPLQTRKQSVQPLLKCIRFLNFTVTELGDVLKNFPDLLTSDEGLKIMLYLYNPPKNPDFSALPPWCNKNTASRCFFSDNPYISHIAINAPGPYVGKVSFPLKTNSEQRTVSQLTSLLQMKCVAGRHQINAIRLSFQPPISERSVIANVSISVHVHPSNFKTSEQIKIGNSETVRVEFTRVIKARTGDLVDIEVEASEIRFYKFLQFDDSGRMPQNPHFRCCVSSRPKEGKLYLISELEYGPQANLGPQGKGIRRLKMK